MKYLLLVAVIVVAVPRHIDSACSEIPKYYQAFWFAMEKGDDRDIEITKDMYTVQGFSGKCYGYKEDNGTVDAEGHKNMWFVFLDEKISKCYKCYHFLFKSVNVVQYKQSSCRSTTAGPAPTLEEVCGDIQSDHALDTMFKKNPDDVQCKTTIEGIYQFSYEVDEGGGGICDSQKSLIRACREPGSPYLDDPTFWMNFTKCNDVRSSKNEYIRFRCLGSWLDETGNRFAAVQHLGKDKWRERFRCMLTRDDQQVSNNKWKVSLSIWGRCNQLRSPYDGPIRLVLQPAIYGEQFVEPTCNFPRNFSGSWYSTGEYDMSVIINTTHIYFKTLEDQYFYKETYFTCIMTRDSRYMVSAVTVGKCEVDHVCFDFVARHQNVLRWRMSKPYRLNKNEMALPNFMHRKFRETCWWSSFTLDRNNVEWTYKTFILDPPSPVDCPIGGRYQFVQTGPEGEKYKTRIRGITERPRNMIDCRQFETEFKVCSDNPKRIQVDAEYCGTLDHTGRPVGEYDEPDNEHDCVGYWMEDMKFYLITYDTEDAISKFRCWVYERLDWRNIIMSRAATANCGKDQKASSHDTASGASLHLRLTESEREYDECPQRFDEGRDPYVPSSDDTVVLSPGRYAKTDNSHANYIIHNSGLLLLSIICTITRIMLSTTVI